MKEAIDHVEREQDRMAAVMFLAIVETGFWMQEQGWKGGEMEPRLLTPFQSSVRDFHKSRVEKHACRPFHHG